MRLIVLTSIASAVAMSAASACTSFGTEDGGPGADAAGGDERTAPEADSAVDATSEQDSARIVACAMVDATFCDDFDHGDPLTKRWRSTPPDNGSSLDVSDAHARSAPASLRVLQPAEGTSFGAELTADLPSFVERFSMSFDILFVDKPTGSGFLVEAQLTPKSSDGDRDDVVGPRLAAYPVKDGVELRAWNWKSNDGLGVPVGTVMVGQWAHVTLSFAPASSGRALSAYEVEGSPRMTRDVASEGAVVSPSVLLGARSGSSRTNVHFDNVVIDAH